MAFLAYASDDGAEVSIFHVFPDADAMDHHMQGVVERSKEAFQFIESAGFEICGAPSDDVLQMMKQIADSGPLSGSTRNSLAGISTSRLAVARSQPERRDL